MLFDVLDAYLVYYYIYIYRSLYHFHVACLFMIIIVAIQETSDATELLSSIKQLAEVSASLAKATSAFAGLKLFC